MQYAEAASDKIEDESLKYKIDLISNTAAMMLDRVELNLDRNYLEKDCLKIKLEPHSLHRTIKMPINMLRK